MSPRIPSSIRHPTYSLLVLSIDKWPCRTKNQCRSKGSRTKYEVSRCRSCCCLFTSASVGSAVHMQSAHSPPHDDDNRSSRQWDSDLGLLRLDRILHSAVFYPYSYGFVPQTLCEDGDPLDVLVMVRKSISGRSPARDGHALSLLLIINPWFTPTGRLFARAGLRRRRARDWLHGHGG